MNILPTIGFIGTGEITSSLVTGFCERAVKMPYPIVLSPRGAKNAARLTAAYPNRVTTAASNQDVLDLSEYVVLAMLPEQGEEICRQLHFRKDHKVINLMCDRTLPQIRSWIGETAALVHMVPSTFNAFFSGPIVLCPPQKEVEDIFKNIGVIVSVDERRHSGVLTSITACMLSFFTLQDRLVQWAKAQGVSSDLATVFTTGFFEAVSAQAVQAVQGDEERLHALATITTPGGVNYLVKNSIDSAKGFDLWTAPLAEALNRLAPES